MNAVAHIDDAVFIQDQQVKTTSLKMAEVFKAVPLRNLGLS